MKAEEFYKQRSNSIRELWALSPKQIEYIALIMEEYAALRQTAVSGACQHEFVWLIPDEDDSLDRKCEKCGFVEWHDR